MSEQFGIAILTTEEQIALARIVDAGLANGRVPWSLAKMAIGSDGFFLRLFPDQDWACGQVRTGRMVPFGNFLLSVEEYTFECDELLEEDVVYLIIVDPVNGIIHWIEMGGLARTGSAQGE